MSFNADIAGSEPEVDPEARAVGLSSRGHGREAYGSGPERVLFLILALIVFGYVVARAVWVPFVHDEARSFFMFIQSGKVLPYEAPWDAANHLLPSVVVLQLYKLFGPSPWVLRAFSVASYMLYAWYVMRTGHWFRSSVVRWSVRAALLGTPFVLDLFSLFRGYGPALAFLLMAMVHGHGFLQRDHVRDLFLCLLAFALAAYSNIALLLPWGGALILLALAALPGRTGRQRWTRIVLFAMLAVVPWIHLADYASHLADRGAFYYGTTDPWMGTLGSVALGVTGIYSPWVLVIPLLLGAVVAASRLIVDPKTNFRSPLMLLMLFILGDMLGRAAMHVFLGTPFPLDRTAIHWVPPLILGVALAVDHISRRVPLVAGAALILLYMPWRVASGANVHTMEMWADQLVDEPMVRAIAERVQASSTPLLLHSTEFAERSLAYEAYWRGLHVPPAYDAIPPGLHDLLIANGDQGWDERLYAPVMRSAAGGLWLLERREQLVTELVLDTTCIAEGMVYSSVWTGDPWQYGSGPVLIDISAHLTTGRSFQGFLVTQMPDEQNGNAFYHGYRLELMRDRWQGEAMHLRIGLPQRPPNAGNTSIYFWDPHERGIRVEDLRLRIRVVSEE